ncbi:MAG: hypothetical protein IJ361_03710 [Spirochaetaceae bacterium]|nr:hypothetical protein [Spirochaetaceae bacterium]
MDTQLKTVNTKQSIIRFFLTAFFVLGGTLLITAFLPPLPEGITSEQITENGISIGFFALIPALFLIVYIFTTKRILEALILATLMCFIFADRTHFLSEFNTGLTSVMMDEDTGWLIIVCGLMGSIIKLIEKTGGSLAFGKFVAKHSKSRVGTLLWTYLLGIIIFIDDYLNSLTVGSCMAPITDKHKVSREELTYIVDSTAAPICVILPISTWAVFASRLFVANGLTTEENSLLYFIKTIPFNFYAWAALIIVLLFILRVIPPIGRMKKADNRVKNGGPVAPPGSEKIDIRGNSNETYTDGKMIDFLLPIACLVLATIFSGIDMQKGVIITLGFMFVLYVSRGLMTAQEFADYCIEGLKNMLLPLILMVLAFLFSYASSRIQFTQTIIQGVLPVMEKIPQLMPLLIFIILGITEFITGTNWGLYIIALPIVIPLAQAVGVNPVLAVSAVLSAGVFGSHICFYSDATIISSSACGCDNFEHGISQMPYGFIGAGISMILFTIAGFLMY